MLIYRSLEKKIEKYVSFADETKDKNFLDALTKCKDLNKEYPYASRDMGGKILQYVYDLTNPIKLFNKYDFAADSLFCEYAYVVDLDKNKFEVYQGFNHEPLTPKDRFYSLTDEKEIQKDSMHRESREKYYPVKLLVSMNLKKLPKTRKGFISRLNKKMPADAQFEYR